MTDSWVSSRSSCGITLDQGKRVDLVVTLTYNEGSYTAKTKLRMP